MIYVSGCSTTKKKIETVYFLPPETLLMDCAVPSRDGVKTVGDMVRIIKLDEEAIALCNANLTALRNYRKGLIEVKEKGKE